MLLLLTIKLAITALVFATGFDCYPRRFILDMAASSAFGAFLSSHVYTGATGRYYHGTGI